jgi:hypothetical protein
MTFSMRKDLAATALTILAVLAFTATHEGWNVWLIGDSRRWAAGAIVLIGCLTCGLGSPGSDRASKLLGTLGATAAILGIVAIATGSLTVLSFLVLDVVALWAGSLLRHASSAPHRPLVR